MKRLFLKTKINLTAKGDASVFKKRFSKRFTRLFRAAGPLALMLGLFTPYIPVQATTCAVSGNNVVLTTCTFDTGTYTFTGTLTVPTGVTVTINGAVTLVSDDIDVQAGGIISADGTGSIGGFGPGAGVNGFGTNGPGAGYGGNGSRGSGGASFGGVTYGSVTAPFLLGSGGGDASAPGGAGGGAIKLSISGAGTITVNGTVRSTGVPSVGSFPGGSGSGGSVWIDAAGGTIAGSGLVTANGGTALVTNPGGGGGGRIAVYYTTDSSTLVSGNKINAYGGGPGPYLGGAGTVYLKAASQTNGTLVVDNNNQNAENTTQVASSLTFDGITVRNGAKYLVPSATTLSLASGGTLAGGGALRPTLSVSSGGTFNFPNASTTFSADLDLINAGAGGVVTDLTVNSPFKYVFNTNTGTFSAGLSTLTAGTGTFSTAGVGTLTVPTITVQSGGTLTHEANTNTQANKLIVSATTIDVQAGGSINVSGKGFSVLNGTGFGGDFGTNGPGAGYGGNGARGVGGASVGGATYGSAIQPIDIGSGGDPNTGSGGNGGGAVKLTVSGTLTVNGSIVSSSDALTGSNAGGSGGSIWIASVGTLAGAGTITAAGGTPASSAPGGGGGGRIAIYYTTDTSSILTPGTKVTAFGGGVGGSIGGAGTILLFHTGVSTNGDFYVENNDQVGANTTQFTTPSTLTFDNATIRKGTRYVLPTTTTLTVSSTGTLTGGGVQALITVNSGGTFNPPSTGAFTLTNLDVTNNGTVGVVTDLTVGPTATFIHNTTIGSFSATLSTLTVGNSGSGTFSTTGVSTLTVPTVTVTSGGNFTHEANTNTQANKLIVSATTINVQAGGAINIVGKGFSGGFGPGMSIGGYGTNGPGAGYGGNGAVGVGDSPVGGNTYGDAKQPADLGSGGDNSAGAGGAGGGAVKLTVSGTLTVNGAINATAGSPTGAGGGGAGGSVWLSGIGTLAGMGTISASGSVPVGGTPGGGGGGRVAVTYATDSSTIISAGNKITVFGAGTAAQIGGAGTIFLKQNAATNGDLIVDNNDQNGRNTTQFTAPATLTFDNVTVRKGAKYVVPSTTTLNIASSGTLSGSGSVVPTLTANSGGTLGLPGITATGTLTVTNNGTLNLSGDMSLTTGTFRLTGAITGGLQELTINGGNFINSSTSQLFSGSDLIVNSGGTYTQDTTTQLVVDTVTVNSGGTITHSDNSTTRAAIVSISATTITIASGGIVTANSLGFDSSEGTGQGTDAATAGGAGHCAAGGNGSTPGAGGSVYDSAANPTTLGSGGGDDINVGGQQGGSGGGEIHLSATGTFTLNGTVSADGASGTANEGGGGSGGSIRLDAATFAGTTGAVTAAGGGGSPTSSAATGGGGGGAGYVAVYYTTSSYSGAFTALGGAKGGVGGASAAVAGGNCTPLIVDAAPTVTGVTASNADGTYVIGQTVNVQVNFSELVNVTGTPTLALATGIPASTIVNFTSGSGTTTLTFNYTVIGGNNAADLDYVATNSLTAGTSIQDGGLNNANLTLASPGVAGSLGANKSIVVDGTPIGPTPNTTSNSVVLSRVAVNAVATATISFTLNDTLFTDLTLTFDSAFTGLNVSGATAFTPSSPGCMTNFVANNGYTFTADKNGCTGLVVISGVTVVNPPTPGGYLVSWVNDDDGYTMVAIVDDDQVTVNASIDPSITFDLDTGTSAGETSAPYSVALGTLTLGGVNHSNNSIINSIFAQLDTNATGGAIVTVLSANASLASASAPSDTIPNSATNMAAGTANYGICVNSITLPTAAAGTFNRSAPYNTGTCDPAGSTNAVKALSTVAPTNILDSATDPVASGQAEILVNAAISTSTAAHSDYSDILTFVATGMF